MVSKTSRTVAIGGTYRRVGVSEVWARVNETVAAKLSVLQKIARSFFIGMHDPQFRLSHCKKWEKLRRLCPPEFLPGPSLLWAPLNETNTMLKNLSPLHTPELLHTLASMGHGDDIAIVDAHFPAVSMAKRLVRLDGVDAPAALEACCV